MEFLRDEKTQDAVIRNFEIIGETARNIERYHPRYAVEHSDVPWGLAYEMRNVLAHGYFMELSGKLLQTTFRGLPNRFAASVKSTPESPCLSPLITPSSIPFFNLQNP